MCQLSYLFLFVFFISLKYKITNTYENISNSDELRGNNIFSLGMSAASALQVLKGLKERQQLTQSGVENGMFYNS